MKIAIVGTRYVSLSIAVSLAQKHTLYAVNIPAASDQDSSVVVTNIPDTEAAFDWFDYHL